MRGVTVYADSLHLTSSPGPSPSHSPVTPAVAVLPGVETVTIIKMEIFITVSSAIKTVAKIIQCNENGT